MLFVVELQPSRYGFFLLDQSCVVVTKSGVSPFYPAVVQSPFWAELLLEVVDHVREASGAHCVVHNLYLNHVHSLHYFDWFVKTI